MTPLEGSDSQVPPHGFCKLLQVSSARIPSGSKYANNTYVGARHIQTLPTLGYLNPQG